MKAPIVFISYSHDSPEHANRVLELSNRLRADGIDCSIDQYEVSPAEGWPKWMNEQITNSDFVLVVCTEIYYRRVTGKEEKGKGLGVKWESTLTFQDIYDEDSTNSKFIPVLFEDGKTDFIPKPIKGSTFYFLPDQYDSLYRHITNQPRVTKPELGSIKTMEPAKVLAAVPALERKTDFFEGTTAGWYLAHPYPMPPNFTGRATELKMLDDWLAGNTNRLFILRALGGFGKSALAWQWINTHVDPAEWKKLVFWSFYEGDASFEHFIEESLKYLKLEVPQGQHPQVDELLKAMQAQKILLIMDGFERALRAYSSMNAAYQADESPLPEGEGRGEGESNQLDCVNINAEFFLKGVCSLPNIKSKVLMTTRLTPRAVKPRGEFMLGCREIELTSMQPADAVEFFRKQKIKGTHAEIEAACALYGYHPLSLRLLAGHILKDFDNPADISVAQKLKIDGDIIQQKHHVLEVSYNSLPPHEQKLLSIIACFRSPVELKTLEAVAENKNSLNDDLHDLVERGLLHFDDKNKKFDLHPIVRRYAYERPTAPDRTAAHTRLRDYFAAVDTPTEPQNLDDLSSVIELYYHILRMNLYEEALHLYDKRLADYTLRMGAPYLEIDLVNALRPYIETKIPLKAGWFGPQPYERILRGLAYAYNYTGQPRQALVVLKSASAFVEGSDNRYHRAFLGNSLETTGEIQLQLGRLRDSEINLRRCVELGKLVFEEDVAEHYYVRLENYQYMGSDKIGDCHLELGLFMAYLGNWAQINKEFILGEPYLAPDSGKWEYQYKSALLLARSSMKQIQEVFPAITQSTPERLALALAKTAFETYKGSHVNYLARIKWLLGAAYRLDRQFQLAEQYLSEAITLDRAINLIAEEANILLDLARLRYDQKNYEEAKSLAEEALLITERCGYVLQGADVNLFLAQYALEQENDKAKAKQYAEEAKKLATCDGPPYYYKVAYEEAERMLKDLA